MSRKFGSGESEQIDFRDSICLMHLIPMRDWIVRVGLAKCKVADERFSLPKRLKFESLEERAGIAVDEAVIEIEFEEGRDIVCNMVSRNSDIT